jgi:hypothetical protein
MRLSWGIMLALSLGLSGCDFPVAGANRDTDQARQHASLSAEDRDAMTQVFRDFLATQQARQQVNLTSSTLIADNSAGILSNHGSSLTKNAPLVAHNTGGLTSNGAYRVAETRSQLPGAYQHLPDGNHFYRLANGEGTFVETFITRVPNASTTAFEVAAADILVHGEMTVTLPSADGSGSWDDWMGDLLEGSGTTHYAIKLLKSPILQGYASDVWITAPKNGGQTQRYVERATYIANGLPVTAEATHSAFAAFGGVDLPTAGEERIRIGQSLLDLNYKNVSGNGVGLGTWKAEGREAWPLTYVYDFGKNLAEMRVSLPEERFLVLSIRPGMQVQAGSAVTKTGETLATLVKRTDGALVLRFSEGDEALLFE